MKEVYFGYVRVSTTTQKVERQIDNILSEFPKCIIYKDHYTGTTLERPSFQEMLKEIDKALSKGNLPIICFDEISRMSRQEEEGYRLYWELFDKGCKLIFLKQRTLDTDNLKETIKIATTGNEIADIYIEATNQVLRILSRQQIKAAFASSEKEASFLRARTKDGIQAKKRKLQAAGMSYDGGRPQGAHIITMKQKKVMELIRQYNKDFNGYLDDKDTLEMINSKLANDRELFGKEKKSCSRNSYYKYKKLLKKP